MPSEAAVVQFAPGMRVFMARGTASPADMAILQHTIAELVDAIFERARDIGASMLDEIEIRTYGSTGQNGRGTMNF